MPILEICAGSVESAIAARDGRAQRIELCAALEVGGVTPSAGLIAEARKVKGIILNVIIRPRGGDFLYDSNEAACMEHDIRTDSGEARFPVQRLGAEYNVVNSLSRRFYLKHGVEHIVDGLDLWATTIGERVMESSYCIRREIGECLKQKPKIKGDLFLEHGTTRYALKFDCAQCMMELWHLS